MITRMIWMIRMTPWGAPGARRAGQAAAGRATNVARGAPLARLGRLFSPSRGGALRAPLAGSPPTVILIIQIILVIINLAFQA